MKIAFILLCHKNSDQINRLLDKLEKFNSEVFIHCDLKNYGIINSIKKSKNIHILKEESSFDIKWGGTEMILATLSLLRSVKDYSENHNIHFDYIWLLSGQDYIIQNPDYIINDLIKNKSMNYLNITPVNSKKYKEYLKRCETKYYNVGWLSKNNFFIKIIKRVYMLLTGGFSHTFSFCKRKLPFDGKFYFGSQWWTITNECADFILNYCDNNKEYLSFFMNTLVPDECFFHTIIMNSKYKDSVKDNLTFVNWKNNRRSPDNLVYSDFSSLINLNKKYFFARKFDYCVDKTILDMIDDYIENKEKLI